MLIASLNKKKNQKASIYRASKKFISLQILQPVGIIWNYLRNFEGPNPQGFEFAVFSFVLPGCIPFEHQIIQLKSLLFTLSVKSLLDLLLMIVGSVHDLFSDLYHFHHLMDPLEHMVRFSFKILEESCYR